MPLVPEVTLAPSFLPSNPMVFPVINAPLLSPFKEMATWVTLPIKLFATYMLSTKVSNTMAPPLIVMPVEVTLSC